MCYTVWDTGDAAVRELIAWPKPCQWPLMACCVVMTSIKTGLALEVDILVRTWGGARPSSSDLVHAAIDVLGSQISRGGFGGRGAWEMAGRMARVS